MATKNTSKAGIPPQDAPDGNTARIDLIHKPGKEATVPVAPSRNEQPDDKTVEIASVDDKAEEEAAAPTEVFLQETKPMDAVAWPPPQAVYDVPTRPPSLRKRELPEAVTASGSTLPVTASHGVLTTELRRALPAWALPLLTAQPVSVWIAARIGMTMLALVATMMIPAIAAQGTANWYGSPGGPSLTPLVNGIGGVWTRWDGQWYLKVAAEGYRIDDGSSAFFPLYPWMVAVFGWLAGERFIWAG